MRELRFRLDETSLRVFKIGSGGVALNWTGNLRLRAAVAFRPCAPKPLRPSLCAFTQKSLFMRERFASANLPYFPRRTVMRYDRAWIEYHLTTSGWIREGIPDEGAEIVETWQELIYEGYEWGSPKRSMIWSNPSFTREQRAALHRQFPWPEAAGNMGTDQEFHADSN